MDKDCQGDQLSSGNFKMPSGKAIFSEEQIYLFFYFNS